MSDLVWTVRSDNEVIRGFRYLWMKRVDDFKASTHCARCLVGPYSRLFGREAAPNVAQADDIATAGQLAYFCGVSSPYVHSKNLHLVGVVEPGQQASVMLWTGDWLVVEGLRQIRVTDVGARKRFPHYSDRFLTCRNFQFGVQHFQAGRAAES